MQALIKRLKTDIAEQSGTSPTFLEDLKKYMSAVEDLATTTIDLAEVYRIIGDNEGSRLAADSIIGRAKQFLAADGK